MYSGWLILWVNLSRTQGALTFGQTLFCVYEGFWKRLTSGSTDRVKQITLLNLSGPHAVS